MSRFSFIILMWMFGPMRCHGFATTTRILRAISLEKRSAHLPLSSDNNPSTNTQDPANEDDQLAFNDTTTKEKHLVQWTTDQGTLEFEAFDGELLRTAALRRGLVSPHNGKSRLVNCRGLGTCGTCAVEIAQGGVGRVVEPSECNARERLRLSFPPHNTERQSPLLRLACQVQVHGDLQVTKRSGFWGQYKDLSPSSEHQTYFGDLEFLLDNKSPEER